MSTPSSRDLPSKPPRHDTEKETQDAVAKDGAQTEGKDREAVHGDGDSIGLDKQDS